MGVPTSEVGYTSAMPRTEDHEVHKGHVVALKEKKEKKTFGWGRGCNVVGVATRYRMGGLGFEPRCGQEILYSQHLP